MLDYNKSLFDFGDLSVVFNKKICLSPIFPDLLAMKISFNFQRYLKNHIKKQTLFDNYRSGLLDI